MSAMFRPTSPAVTIPLPAGLEGHGFRVTEDERGLDPGVPPGRCPSSRTSAWRDGNAAELGRLDLYPEDAVATIADRLRFCDTVERALDLALGRDGYTRSSSGHAGSHAGGGRRPAGKTVPVGAVNPDETGHGRRAGAQPPGGRQ